MFDQKYYREKLRDIKEGRLMTLKELCKELGISYGTINRFFDESGCYKISYTTAKKIIEFAEDHDKRESMHDLFMEKLSISRNLNQEKNHKDKE